MRTLFLHIGHGKTGSSMLQSSFRLSRGALSEVGILYGAGADATVVSDLQITSGNGSGLLTSPNALPAALARYAGGTQNLLYSSEMLFAEFLAIADPGMVVKAARAAGFDRISVLLLVRDPMGHAASLWQQGVKRGGKTWTIEESYQQYKFPMLVARLLTKLSAFEHIMLTVRNYSVCRNTLLAETAAWLGVAPATLVAPKGERVNRSMTRAELELQLAFNRAIGKSGDLISDPLCEKLDSIRPDDLRPSAEVQRKTWVRLLPHIQSANAYLPEGHKYTYDLKEAPPQTALLQFTPEQIEVFAASVCARIVKLRNAQAKPMRPAVSVAAKT